MVTVGTAEVAVVTVSPSLSRWALGLHRVVELRDGGLRWRRGMCLVRGWGSLVGAVDTASSPTQVYQ